MWVRRVGVSALLFKVTSNIGSNVWQVSEVDKIILTARSKEKAQGAIQILSKESGKPESFFSYVVLDLANYQSVMQAAVALPAGIDRVCLNAGGAYAGMHELGITNTYIPTLGHAILLDQLLGMKKIPDGARVAYVSSEVTRPIWALTGALPGHGRIGCWGNFCTSSCWDEKNVEDVITRDVSGCGDPCCIRGHCLPFRGILQQYASGKLVGSLYFAQVAKENPNIKVYSISPGAVADAKRSDFVGKVGFPMKQLMGYMPGMFVCIGVAHSMEAGAQRYVDALTGDYDWESGAMPMSGEKLCGVCLWGAKGRTDDNRKFSSLLRDEKLYAKAGEVTRKWMAKWGENQGTYSDVPITPSAAGGGGSFFGDAAVANAEMMERK